MLRWPCTQLGWREGQQCWLCRRRRHPCQDTARDTVLEARCKLRHGQQCSGWAGCGVASGHCSGEGGGHPPREAARPQALGVQELYFSSVDRRWRVAPTLSSLGLCSSSWYKPLGTASSPCSSPNRQPAMAPVAPLSPGRQTQVCHYAGPAPPRALLRGWTRFWSHIELSARVTPSHRGACAWAGWGHRGEGPSR